MDLANLPFPHPRELPTGDDIRHSKTIIEQLDKKIEDIEQTIGRLQVQLQEVQQKRTNYASYISPLRRLPTEILSEIVTICLDDGRDILTVAGICGRLREVALGMTAVRSWRGGPSRVEGTFGRSPTPRRSYWQGSTWKRREWRRRRGATKERR
jgi:hypothetical protein